MRLFLMSICKHEWKQVGWVCKVPAYLENLSDYKSDYLDWELGKLFECVKCGKQKMESH